MHIVLWISYTSFAAIDDSDVLHLPQNEYTEKYNIHRISSDNLLDDTNYDVINIIDNQDNPLIFTSPPSKSSKSLLITDTAEYLKSIPGFSVMRNGGTNNEPVFRGMVGSQLRILIDNGEMLGACLSHMDPSSSYIASETFDILNIIKGPQTVLWGPVVAGGILHFQRYSANFNSSTMKFKSNIMIGSNNSANKNVDTILGNKYGYIRLIGSYNCSDDYRDGNNYRVPSAWHKWNADAVLSFNYNTDTRVQINFGQGNGNANYATRSMDGICFARDSYALQIETVDISSVLNKIEFYAWCNNMYHLMTNKVSDITRIQSSPYLWKQKNCCRSTTSNNVNYMDRCLWGMRGIVSYQWENIQHHSGVDFQMNQHKKNTNLIHSYQIDTISKDAGIFTEFSFDVTSYSKFLGGVRLEYLHMVNVNYDAGAAVYNTQYDIIYPAGFVRYEHHIYPSCLYYIGLGTCQRFPDYLELISIKSDNNAKRVNDILQLKPEKTIQIDVGSSFQRAKFNGWISSYMGYIKDYIFYDISSYQIHNTVTNVYVNNVRAMVCGAEIGFDYRLSKFLYGESNVSWEFGMNIDDKRILPTIPPLEGVFTCKFKRQNCNIGTSWRLVSSSQFIKKIISCMNLNNSTCLESNINKPGFGILSIYAVWDFSKYYIFSLGVNNVFNKNYQEHILNIFNYFESSEYFKKIQIYEPGRTWWIKTGISI